MNVDSGLLRHLRARPLVQRFFTAITTVALLSPAAPGATEDPKPFAPVDLVAVRQVSDPRVSPDGAWVAFVVGTGDIEEDRATSDLWMVSWDGVRTLQLTHTAKESESQPRWSPDNRYLGFLAARGDEDAKDQVWLLDRAGGEARQVTSLPGGVSDFAWSPDGKRLALIATDPDPEDPWPGATENEKAKEKKKTPAPIVIDRYLFKKDGSGYLRHFRDHLYLYDVETATAELLTPGDYDEFSPVWSPDGSRIAFVSKRDGDPDRNENSDVSSSRPDPAPFPSSSPGSRAPMRPATGAPRPGAPTARRSPTCREDPASTATTTRRPSRRSLPPAGSPG